MRTNTKRALIIGGVLIGLLASSIALAQNWRLPPRYGAVTLRTGFTPDPHNVNVTAGGDIRTSQGGCSAYTAANPDFNLTFTAGSLPLNIYVTSAADTTLLINLPDGRWVCNDDSSGLNPLVNLPRPPSGLYNIYVGTYNQTPAPAVLHISELAPRF